MPKNKKTNQTKHSLGRIPHKTKFKRLHKGRILGFKFNVANQKLVHGVFGLKILKSIRLKQTHLNSIRNTLFRQKLLKKQHNHTIWLRGIFDIPVTKKPKEIRMGKGKGAVSHWVMRVKPGKILCELSTMSFLRAKRVFLVVQHALGVPTRMIVSKKYYKNLRFNKSIKLF